MSVEMQNGRAATEVTTPPVADAQALIPRADTAKNNDELARRQVAAFLMTMFLDDLLASASIARQLEAGPMVCDIDAWEALPPC